MEWCKNKPVMSSPGLPLHFSCDFGKSFNLAARQFPWAKDGENNSHLSRKKCCKDWKTNVCLKWHLSSILFDLIFFHVAPKTVKFLRT